MAHKATPSRIAYEIACKRRKRRAIVREVRRATRGQGIELRDDGAAANYGDTLRGILRGADAIDRETRAILRAAKRGEV